jgi:hypothetical protein
MAYKLMYERVLASIVPSPLKAQQSGFHLTIVKAHAEIPVGFEKTYA